MVKNNHSEFSEEEKRRQERNAFFILLGVFAFVALLTFLLWWVRKSFL
ncbi:MAG: hypothetical protein KC506_01760 [Nanoarchaeota archaeon]|nr:hypothetical protein [Nanoarchaeota archaeon]